MMEVFLQRIKEEGKMGTSYQEFEEEMLRNPKVKAEHDALEPKYQAEAKRIRKRAGRQMKDGYRNMTKRHKRFAKDSLPLCGEVLPPFDKTQREKK